MKNKLQILSVRVETVFDESPDTSYLGEYSNTPGLNAIDRQERGDMERGQYRYFNPAMSGEETGNPDSPEQDYQRMESLNRGEWNYVGVIAKAEVWNPATRITQTIRSGGLWGIESDSEQDHLESVTREELANLRGELEVIGLGERAIARAFGSVETVTK